MWLDLREEGQMPKLIATTPVRDEEWILERSLTDLSLYVDEIVVLDDGSTDRTPEIIRSFPKVTSIHTNPIGTKPFGNGQESVNRNRLLSMARARNAEVILQIDADEVFEDKIKTELPNILAKRASTRFQLCHLWGDIDHFRVDGEYGDFFRFRLYWVNRRLRFTPQPIIATPRGWDRKNTATSGVKIVHYGWLHNNTHLRRYHEVYHLKHRKNVSFEEFKSSKEMQDDLRIINQGTDGIQIKTWAEVMGAESQEKYRL
jgi:glycosyltransferase involved in cell wall biosynthesis